jgi:hypothetical protein
LAVPFKIRTNLQNPNYDRAEPKNSESDHTNREKN